ncbi:heat stress transcription factor A-6b-like isoform X2 [Prosopis cineraria]|uniref:heat stress transcription factor A-6b-like isoform X2 n=1 Tax=Prosopis cineraria TaxID=364024 RepID=UPI00240F225C|nr:heat stress transcription factor A-6b-like isoform X2 [Prosopis cineraria]
MQWEYMKLQKILSSVTFLKKLEAGYIIGFRKVDPDRWEFANEGFLRGQKHLLKNIRRRKTPQHHHPALLHQQALDPCVEVGRFGLDGEINRLRRDKQVLMLELVKLRQQQQNTKTYLQQMEGRLKRTEQKQQQMMNFLARAMQNPNFVQQLVQQKEWKKELEEAISKKRRRTIDQGPSSHDNNDNLELLGQLESSDFVEELETDIITDPADHDVADEDLDLIKKLEEEDQHAQQLNQHDDDDEVILVGSECIINGESTQIDDEVFWQDLLNEDVEEVIQGFEEDVEVLAEQVGYLASDHHK